MYFFLRFFLPRHLSLEPVGRVGGSNALRSESAHSLFAPAPLILQDVQPTHPTTQARRCRLPEEQIPTEKSTQKKTMFITPLKDHPTTLRIHTLLGISWIPGLRCARNDGRLGPGAGKKLGHCVIGSLAFVLFVFFVVKLLDFPPRRTRRARRYSIPPNPLWFGRDS